MNDDAKFCPHCAAPNLEAHQSVDMHQSDDMPGGEKPNPMARIYLVRGVVAIAALILGIVSLAFLIKLVSSIEGVITVFSALDGLTTGLGIAGYILCGSLLAGVAALASAPLIRFAMERNGLGQDVIDRAIVLVATLIVLCIATWICKLIFHSPMGGNVSLVLYTIFNTFGGVVTGCFVPVIIAIVILYLVRTKLVATTTVRY